MAHYSFLTTWLLDSPRERVWDAIYDQERWPEWWRGVEEAEEIQPGDDGGTGIDGVGSVARLVWKSLLPYRVEFEVTTTKVERPHLLEADAVGELTGVGRWRLYEQNGATAVLYEWNVATTKAWMNLVAPIARPAFEWNHDWVMARGGEGIAKLLGCRLLASG
ncbi:MAG: SRPBCC family protein [Solirubrobacterales bacterium]